MTELSEFAKAIKARPRKCHTFDVGGFFGLGGSPVAKVAIRVATKAEQDVAVVEAHKYAASLAGKELQEAARDRDILEEAKTAHILSMVVRDANRPAEMPCFPSGGWMMAEMTVDQLAVLLNLYEEVKNREAPYPVEIDTDRLHALSAGLSASAGTDIPEAGLSGCSRPYLTHALVLLSVELEQLRAKVASLEPASEG